MPFMGENFGKHPINRSVWGNHAIIENFLTQNSRTRPNRSSSCLLYCFTSLHKLRGSPELRKQPILNQFRFNGEESIAMATAAQIEANRRNSQKSSGPRTEEGKYRSRLNALDHGCRAKIMVLPTEDFGEYENELKAWKLSFSLAIRPRKS